MAWSTSTRNDTQRHAVSVEEKPLKPKLNYAVSGLYFYASQVCDIAASIVPSAHGELEITDVNRAYQACGQLNAELMGRGMAWLDTGTHESLLDAGQFIATIKNRQGLKIACPEEIAYRKGYIGAAKLKQPPQPFKKKAYGQSCRAYWMTIYSEAPGAFQLVRMIQISLANPGHNYARCVDSRTHRISR